ncbi:hypothetical protein V757_07935 [Pelistega indica]|uniref:Uncharacterized protein n=1 Tax=Pelistega indica TaxID=1414851 RepID=V8G423_9BURK|nr:MULTISPECIES: hypothetical protein [Pelistega]ETD70427.1 hypothetical protein V757_07935 [Pelistega indica]
MKAIIKVLMVLGILGLVTFGAWKVLDSTLFAEEDTDTSTPAITADANINNEAQNKPKTMSKDEAFSQTSDDDNGNDTNEQLTCEAANDTIQKLYDMRMKDKPVSDALTYIEDEATIPEQYLEAFKTFSNLLWSTSKDHIKPLSELREQFSEKCLNAEK